MRHVWHVVFLALLMLSAGSASAMQNASDSWEVDKDHSTVGFKIRHIVGYVPGVFGKFSGEVAFDPKTPDQGHFYLLIDSASVHTGVPKRDEHLRSEDFLDTARSPRIIFASKKVIPRGADELIVVGDLTIKDVTAEIQVPVRLLGIADHPFKDKEPNTRVLGLQAQFSINRVEFHVGTEKWTQMGVMGDTIFLTVDMELLQRK